MIDELFRSSGNGLTKVYSSSNIKYFLCERQIEYFNFYSLHCRRKGAKGLRLQSRDQRVKGFKRTRDPSWVTFTTKTEKPNFTMEQCISIFVKWMNFVNKLTESLHIPRLATIQTSKYAPPSAASQQVNL